MGSNEEYLDSLLSSLTAMGEDENLPQEQEMSAGAVDTSEFALEEIPEEDDILSMLSAESDAGGYAEEESIEQNAQGDDFNPDSEPNEMSLDDIDAMLASLAGDTSLEEAEESEDTRDSVSTADDDMLAMLESLPDEESTEEIAEPDFDFFSGEEEYSDEYSEEETGEVWEDEKNFAIEQETKEVSDLPEESLDLDAISEAIGVQNSPFEELGAEESDAEAAEGKKEKKRFFKDRKKKKKDIEKPEEKQPDEIAETEDAYEDMDVLESVLQSAQEEEFVEEKTEKKSAWKRFIDFLMEEEEEEEDTEEELPIGNPSEENQELLDELSAEDKKKDKKKGKKKKGKKGKEKDTEEAVDEETEEAAEPEKKKKKRKKKEKSAEEEQKREPEKKLSKKKILTVFAFCGTIAFCILLLNMILPGTMEKRDARVAYDQQNYEVAYDLFVGKKLNEEDELIFRKSSVIMQMKHTQEEYEVYRTLEKNLEALDVLVRAVSNYPEMQRKAEKYKVEAQVQEVYDEILQTLEQDFGVTQEAALDAAASEDDLTYTKKLTAMLSGFIYDPESGEITDEKQDILPEEEEFLMEMQD